ncbi:hypothetical protein BCEP4_1250049 [Burkholderia cepacia]|nr:hypothetical protein BCEP4_1250049 [Burkholderia cepacia]
MSLLTEVGKILVIATQPSLLGTRITMLRYSMGTDRDALKLPRLSRVRIARLDCQQRYRSCSVRVETSMR